jgi:hypothetical protein
MKFLIHYNFYYYLLYYYGNNSLKQIIFLRIHHSYKAHNSNHPHTLLQPLESFYHFHQPILEYAASELVNQFIIGRQSVMGWYGGTPIDSQDTLAFCTLSGVRSMNETFPLEDAEEAYEEMMRGKVRFRAVLTTGH